MGTNPLWFVAGGDFNGDGKMDLATANHGGKTVMIALGDGKGGFAATSPAAAAALQPSVLGAADFDRNGLMDLVTVNAGANDFSVLAQQAGTPAAPIAVDVLWFESRAPSAEQQLAAQNGVNRTVMQTDGNFVVYQANDPTAASSTSGQGFAPYSLRMQSDGNLVLDAYLNRCAANVLCAATWASNTSGKGVAPYVLTMQSDGNLVIYDSTLTPIWATSTSR